MSRTVGIRIEGVGFDTSKSGGAVFCDSNELPTSSTYEWVNAISRAPGAFAVKVNPFTGEWTSPGFSFDLSRSGRLAVKLLSTQVEVEGSSGLGFSDTTSTTLTFTSGAPNFDNNSIAFVGDEVVLLGTRVATTFTGCVRGLFGSTPQAHAINSNVRKRNPYLYLRRVDVIQNLNGVETVIWSGLLETIKAVGGSIQISCMSYLQHFADQESNLTARNIRVWTPQFGESGDESITQWSVNGYDNVVATGAYKTGGTLSTSYQSGVFEVGGALVVGYHRIFDGTFPRDSVRYVTPTVSAADGTAWTTRYQDILDADIYAVFCVSRSVDNVVIYDGDAIQGVSATLPLAVTTGLAYAPYHPVAVALALMVSSGTASGASHGVNGEYDILSAKWGLGVDYINLSSFTAEIAGSSGVAIDHLVLGEGGSSFRSLDVIQEKLLKPYGYSLALDNQGQLTLVRVALPSVLERAEAQARSLKAYPDTDIEQDLQVNERPWKLSVETGDGFFGIKQAQEVRVLTDSTRPQRDQNSRLVKLDMTTVSAARLTTSGGPSALTTLLAQNIFIGLSGLPLVKFRCASFRERGLNDFYAGKFVAIEDLGSVTAWFIDKDGQEVHLSPDSVTGYGMLVAVSEPFDRAYVDVEVLMVTYRLGDFIRLRAPATKAVSYNSGTFTLVTSNAFSDNDLSYFKVGDQLSLWSSAGELKSTMSPVISSISAPNMVLLGDFGALTTVVDGDIVRIAESTVFDNTALVSDVKRPYAYIGNDPNGTFEDVDGVSQSDFYGSRAFFGFDAQTLTVPDFTSVDEEAIEPASSTEAWPLDSYLEHTFTQNERNLLTSPRQCAIPKVYGGITQASSIQNHRGFATADKMAIQVVPLTFNASVGRVGFTGNLSARLYQDSAGVLYWDDVETVAGDTPASEDIPNLSVDIYTASGVKLTTPGSQRNFTWEGNDGTGDNFGFFEVSVTLGIPAPASFAGYAVLWCEPLLVDSGEVEIIDSTSSNWTVTNEFTLEFDGGTFGQNTAGPGYRDLTLTAFRVDRDNGNATPNDLSDDYVDILRKKFNFDNSKDQWWFGNQEITPTGTNGGSFKVVTRQLFGLWFKDLNFFVQHYDLSAPPTQELYPGTPVASEIELSHLVRTRQAYGQGELLHVGPAGIIEGQSFSPTPYNQRWLRRTFDDGEIKEAAILHTREDSSEITVALLLCPTAATYNPKDQEPENISDSDQIIMANWQITATVRLFNSGVFSTIKTESVVIPVRHWFTYLKSQNLLMSEYTMNTENFALKEGSFFPGDEKYFLQTELSFPVERPGNTMIELEIKIEPTGTPEISGTKLIKNKNIQLALAGYSVTERGL